MKFLKRSRIPIKMVKPKNMIGNISLFFVGLFPIAKSLVGNVSEEFSRSESKNESGLQV